ncbi:MAG: oxidoreductase [Flavobacteriales bacterium CG03_land_8_20_14_0_80_35_15]|nr:Gfo/Idh/MocA family oxidoreductase [Zetaproteobacteria bacterium]PIV16690.1 MAG: oxidoreductase [Flavobacteriales bacterium CG03_land_8_20_14_0_80_35_15]PIX07754.1 MAG: oxidoreductase [Flavobacteriales bacterium CG_4_8_14_3_um_filter_35_10]PJA06951.1 MAG: oxidoreductase [Flavobacteriales bacterium CG_4_10_14_0_2_um_filter_35_18]
MNHNEKYDFKKNNANFKPKKPITVITIGAGARGNIYSDYALKFPNQMKIVGVVEPNPIRNQRFSKKHNIPNIDCFKLWKIALKKPKFADAVIISTPDNLHYEPCMLALEMGYDVLIEKPVSPTEEECQNILAQAKKTGRIVAVCHVLRYAPYFIELKRLIASGAIGELISINHFEPIEHIHMSHSYVRGNWHNSKKTTPIILAKSCHDMDILRWLINKPFKSIASYGDLKWFKKENAPEGSTNRCIEGCKVEATCPYSAMKIYNKKGIWNYVFDFPEDELTHEDFFKEQLKTTDYGRCVYKMDNDQPDHYVTSMAFEDGITANFAMEAFTGYHGRQTRIMGAMGDIVGDMETFTHTDFRTGKITTKKIIVADSEQYVSHGGGDAALVADWVRAVSEQDASLLSSTIDVSIESHIMCFLSEKSRLEKRMIQV